MKKMGKRFVALSIVFASIVSFLPMQIGSNGKAANAITTQIEVSGTATKSGDSIAITNGEYSTQQPYKDFTISVEDKIVLPENIKIGETGIVDQEVIIKSIDGIKLDGNTLDDNNTKLDTLGCSISKGTIVFTDDNNNKRIGATITGLPFGINTIEYQIKETTRFNKGKAAPTTANPNAQTDDLQNPVENYFPSSATAKQITIQHANNFVQQKINPMTFNSYIGSMDEYNANTNPKGNGVPFLFSQDGEYNKDCPLRYTFNVSDAVSTVQYTMNFADTVPIDNNTKVYKNGTLDSSVTINNKAISGYLKDLAASDLMVVKLSENGTNVSKAYAIQLKYNTIASDKDYTLRKAGIKKLYFDADDTVEAYVDKKFTVLTENDVTTYRGTIHIDKRAQMISIEPELGTKGNIAYKLSNHYNSASAVESSRIINGQSNPYVDFNKGTSNQLWVEVYEGSAGNIKEGTSPLAIYKLDVVPIGSESSEVKFSVGSDSYLTQPGRTGVDNKIDFTASRRTYDLHFFDEDTTKATNNVSIILDTPKTYQRDGFTRREYLKAWGGTSTQSDNVTEIADLGKNPDINVDITKYKKIIVQAYYDQIIYEKDAAGKETPKITQYPLGEKYTFYIAKNPDQQIDTGTTKSSEAGLSNITAANGTIKSTEGSTGFSSGRSNYTVTVPKIDTSSAITVTAINSKVSDITATMGETGDEYGLVSGQPFDFPLNTSGGTNIKIVVTAEDGVTKKTYNITINNDTRGASALLKNVITDNGDFTFDSEKDPNKIRVDQAINKIKVSPVAENSKSRIFVNGISFTGLPVTIDLKGTQKTNMVIKVTAEDGSASKTYNFEIYRTDAAIDTKENDYEGDLFFDEIDDCWVDLSKYEEWGTVDGKAVYFNNKGRQVKDQWIKTKGVLYYLDSKGYKATGWRKEVGGKTYFLDPSTGAIKTGWLNQNNKWYYLGLNGVMQKGWLNLNGHWYYFTPEGEMIINQSMYIDDGTYRFGGDGVMY